VRNGALERYFPVRIAFAAGMGLPAREWSVTYSTMHQWLIATVGLDRHAVLGSNPPGGPETISVLFASLDDARAFVERFQVPIAPMGAHPGH
jgi:hypothetical protein